MKGSLKYFSYKGMNRAKPPTVTEKGNTKAKPALPFRVSSKKTKAAPQNKEPAIVRMRFFGAKDFFLSICTAYKEKKDAA